MDFLVTMTTHVPDGTAPEAVDEVRTREAVRAKELAGAGTLLRLWRPPLQPGEWRTLGLLVAADDQALETALASMPLRVWRTDEVMALAAHPNDPATTNPPSDVTEFLITMTITVPAGTPAEVVDDTRAREAQRARELSARGHLLRLWALPMQRDSRRTLGLWSANDAAEMSDIISALPLYPWMSVEFTELSAHPSDPAHDAEADRDA
jgi:muconolactone delta-isomerase